MLVGVDNMATGSHVNVDGVRQRRTEVTTTTITAAHSQRRRRSRLALGHDGVLHASEPHVARRLRRGEVDQGEVDALAAANDNPPGTRQRRRRRARRKTDVGR